MSSIKMLDPPVMVAFNSSSSSLEQINPFTATDEAISNHIIGIHDSQAPKYDVGSLYNVVSNIVKSSTHIGTSLDLKRPKAVELVEDKVPQSSFMPPFGNLKEIACQMTCKPFEKSTAHETVVGILEKLKSYSWEAKAVIALSAFALAFGETWRLSLMERTNESALELHIFRLGEEAKPSKNNLDLINTLVDVTSKLIEGISTLEKKIADKSLSQTFVSCSSRTLCLLDRCRDWNIKSEVVGKLNHVSMRLSNELAVIKREEDDFLDRKWREEVFMSPSGTVDLLRTLIFSKEITELEIFDNTTQEVVRNNVLRTKNILLFISGLDNIEDEVWVLKSIHDAFKKDKEKQNYEILWVPVVEETDDHKITDDQKEKFKQLKSNMPW
ncbi:protein SIEVE ELEMENT OCCLUSION B-like [Neltuma alba]|uniref:protein SIEVE ELEMENT OCCLUSION B-like n=1 Tax=Neltuma alba TaxID=207710 RepID=UPI0010A4D6D0|nr:protein SIEVE ELEMENT OCCLUSION B-like [Prosopis alba]